MSGGGVKIRLTRPQERELVLQFSHCLIGLQMYGDLWRGRRVVRRSLRRRGLTTGDDRHVELTLRGKVVAAGLVGGYDYDKCSAWLRKHRTVRRGGPS